MKQDEKQFWSWRFLFFRQRNFAKWIYLHVSTVENSFFFSFFAWGKSCYVERGWKSKNNEYDDIVCQNTFVTLRNFTLTKPNFSKLSWNQRVQLVTLVGADFTKYFSSESFSHKFQSFFFVKLRISFSSFEGSCFHEKNRLDLFSKIFFLMCVQSKTT